MYKPWLLGSALALCLAGFAGCAADTDVVVELDGGADSASPPTFTEPSVEAAADVSKPLPDTMMCIGTECPDPWTTCPSWDGTLVQKCSTNLLNDPANCGACGNACPPFESLSMNTRCVNGACQRECAPANARDCNGLVDDGCEIDVDNDPANCGACGTTCPSGVRCFKGKCGCPAGQVDCGEGEGCVDVSRNNWNCGACGNVCPERAEPPPYANTEYGCGNSECGKIQCTTGWREAWANCNSDLELDGCEINTATDPNNCGSCGNKCAPGQFCLSDGINPPKCACEPGQTRCGSDPNFSCADLQNDTVNCGACGHQCPGSIYNGAPICRKGFCDYVCDQGFGDCDGDPSNGCETDLRTSGAHCGACGNRCDTSAGQPCIEGKCLMVECDAGEITK